MRKQRYTQTQKKNYNKVVPVFSSKKTSIFPHEVTIIYR